MTTRYRRSLRFLGPSWLMTEGEGPFIERSIGKMMDAFMERTRQGLRARFPSYAPESALAPLGRDRRIIRGIDEPTASYSARLLSWLDDHRVRGNPWKLLEQLRSYCQADVRVRTVDQRGNWFTIDRDGTKSYLLDQGNWDWDGAADSPNWARFWVIIYPTSDGQPWEIEDTWGTSGLWGTGAHWGDGGVWGTTATPGQVGDIRSIVQQWSPIGTRCEWIIIAFDDASFDPASPEPDGTWGPWSKISGGVAVPTRLSTARYWRGKKDG